MKRITKCICGKPATNKFTYGYKCKEICLCKECSKHFKKRKIENMEGKENYD